MKGQVELWDRGDAAIVMGNGLVAKRIMIKKNITKGRCSELSCKQTVFNQK